MIRRRFFAEQTECKWVQKKQTAIKQSVSFVLHKNVMELNWHLYYSLKKFNSYEN
jgi:hypothetical protein